MGVLERLQAERDRAFKQTGRLYAAMLRNPCEETLAAFWQSQRETEALSAACVEVADRVLEEFAHGARYAETLVSFVPPA